MFSRERGQERKSQRLTRWVVKMGKKMGDQWHEAGELGHVFSLYFSRLCPARRERGRDTS